jgi:hypothetical protein
MNLVRIAYRRKLALDLVFFLWLGYAAVSGQVLPDQVVGLFRSDPPAVVVTEPDAAPNLIEPALTDSPAPEA